MHQCREELVSERLVLCCRCVENGGRTSPSSPFCPLTTGCPALDAALVVHLRNCSAQLLVGHLHHLHVISYTHIMQLGFWGGSAQLPASRIDYLELQFHKDL